ncbi:Olfactory Receptor 2M2 [Manis pentadactyla]|nr:Olfactory Receptor 2M2 [Manis pentadactyla]
MRKDVITVHLCFPGRRRYRLRRGEHETAPAFHTSFAESGGLQRAALRTFLFFQSSDGDFPEAAGQCCNQAYPPLSHRSHSSRVSLGISSYVENMGRENETSIVDFVLLGLFPGTRHVEFLICTILLVYVVAITGNTILILLLSLEPQLHSPMYFLLSQLSLMDIFLISTTVPKMLTNFFSGTSDISYTGCGIQMYLHSALGGSECILLTLMAYDRYIAICNPLRYVVIMNSEVCLQMAVMSWLGGAFNSLVQTTYTMHFPRCGSRKVHHFFCELQAVLKLSCEDTSTYNKVVFVIGIIFLLTPFGLILTSYIFIFLSVVHLNSSKARNKALATCSSHLMVVFLYFGPTMFIYMIPSSLHTAEQDEGLSVFYTILTPMMNPLIYSLRNREVGEALRKILGKA